MQTSDLETAMRAELLPYAGAMPVERFDAMVLAACRVRVRRDGPEVVYADVKLRPPAFTEPVALSWSKMDEYAPGCTPDPDTFPAPRRAETPRESWLGLGSAFLVFAAIGAVCWWCA